MADNKTLKDFLANTSGDEFTDVNELRTSRRGNLVIEVRVTSPTYYDNGFGDTGREYCDDNYTFVVDPSSGAILTEI